MVDLEQRVEKLEKLSHEPQNYKQKCEEMEERINHLENELNMITYRIDKFMKQWGPDVQKRRDERDERWDEMVRVLTIQKKHNRNK